MNAKLFEGDITRVHGIKVGQAENQDAMTGCTVVLCLGDGAVGGVSVRGAAPGTRETDLLRPGNLVEKANAVVLAGGSAFGLEAASGVMNQLERMGYGIDMGVARVPIVPSAILYDLEIGDPRVRPDAEMGRQALMNAKKGMRQGCYGAGCGCTVGKLVPGGKPQKSGVGSASITLPEGVTVGAVVAVNAVGDVYHPHTGQLLGCAHMPDGTPIPADALLFGHTPGSKQLRIQAGANTTIGVIATDCRLTKEQANRLADVGHDGYARTIRPVHTQMDGDTLFALGTGSVDKDVNFVKICAAAAEVTARAIANALISAQEK